MAFEDYTTHPFTKFDKDWALLTAGTMNDFNSMTISWGGMGTMWSAPVAFLVVKPSRYTSDFLRRHDEITLSWYPRSERKALGIFGTQSGRDTDKVKETGFTPVEIEGAVTYREAEETLVCRKLFMQQLDIDLVPQEIRNTFYLPGTKEGFMHQLVIARVLSIHTKEAPGPVRRFHARRRRDVSRPPPALFSTHSMAQKNDTFSSRNSDAIDLEPLQAILS